MQGSTFGAHEWSRPNRDERTIGHGNFLPSLRPLGIVAVLQQAEAGEPVL